MGFTIASSRCESKRRLQFWADQTQRWMRFTVLLSEVQIQTEVAVSSRPALGTSLGLKGVRTWWQQNNRGDAASSHGQGTVIASRHDGESQRCTTLISNLCTVKALHLGTVAARHCILKEHTLISNLWVVCKGKRGFESFESLREDTRLLVLAVCLGLESSDFINSLIDRNGQGSAVTAMQDQLYFNINLAGLGLGSDGTKIVLNHIWPPLPVFTCLLQPTQLQFIFTSVIWVRVRAETSGQP